MMAAEKKHRCGGILWPSDVQIRIEQDKILVVHHVPGLVCERCKEELLSGAVVELLESHRNPWAPTFLDDDGPADG
jgi:YgiT-type zinc finger domain-containing protein